MAKRDNLRQEMKKAGIKDYRLERGRRVNLFALLKSLGVDNPKQTLTRFVHDEIKTSKEIEAAGSTTTGSLSLGPWTYPAVLGFVNRTGKTITISDEKVRGTGTIVYRRLEGVNKTLPISIGNGQIFEVYVTDIGSSNFGGPRFYVAYKVS